MPVDPAAVVTNYSFRDMDNNALNNWVALAMESYCSSRAGNTP